MPNVSGSFAAKATLQSTVSLKDQSGRELGLVEISGIHKSPDPRWEGARLTYWGIADLVAGSGSQRGYFLNEHAGGDTSRGTFEGKITTAAGVTTLEGSWRLTGGTGGLAAINGGGTYSGRMTSPSEIETSWEGTYQLP